MKPKLEKLWVNEISENTFELRIDFDDDFHIATAFCRKESLEEVRYKLDGIGLRMWYHTGGEE